MWWALLACQPEDERAASLADEASRVLEGSADRPYGDAVYAVGDVDGDGADDLAVAWVEERDHEDRTGHLDIWTGRGHVATISDTVSGTWIVAPGECSTPRVPGNVNVVGLGDLDGDGLDELAVGFPRAGNGLVSIFSGSQLHAGAELGARSAPWLLEPADHTWSFGTDLAVGDVDGDDWPDLVVGAPITDAPLYGGEAYAFAAADLAHGDNAGDEVAMRFGTNDQGLQLGERVAVLDDLDGDGRDEVALLASACSRSPEEGYVSIVPGDLHVGPGHRTTADLARWYSLEPRLNLVSLGDADGDGRGDLALGGVADDEGLHTVLVLEGRRLEQGGYVDPSSRRISTGGDSRNALDAWTVGGTVELLAYDGGYVVRVADPVQADGWYKRSSWTTPCEVEAVEGWRSQLATGDFDGDGEDELAFAEPGWPDCEADQPGAVFLIDP